MAYFLIDAEATGPVGRTSRIHLLLLPGEEIAMPVQNAEIPTMFDQAAELLELIGENPFHVRAYRRAARTIEVLPESVRRLLSAGTDLSELPGIEKDLAKDRHDCRNRAVGSLLTMFLTHRSLIELAMLLKRKQLVLRSRHARIGSDTA